MQNNYFNLQARLDQLRMDGCLFVVGLLIALLGLLAIISSFTATKITMLLFGALLLLAGLAQGGHALLDRGVMYRSRIFSGFLYVVVGLILLLDPVGGAIGLTLLISLFLLLSGIVRLLAAWSVIRLNLPPGWHLFVGGLNIVLAILILQGWPETGNWLIGFVIGVELLLAGVMTSFATRTVHQQPNR